MKLVHAMLGVVLPAAIPGLAHPDSVPPGTRLVELAALLERAPPPLPTDFAHAALQEMILAYSGEAELARQDKRARVRNPGLPRWSRNVESYSRHLQDKATELRHGARSTVAVGSGRQVILYLDSGPVVVSGPRISEPLALEKRILARFCVLHPCDALLAMHRPAMPPQADPPEPAEQEDTGPDALPSTVKSRMQQRHSAVSVSWSFSIHRGPVCRGDGGLELQFRDSRELVRKRRFCTRVIQELNELAAALEGYHLAGVQIDWNALRVEQGLVRLNREGEQLRLALPALTAVPEIVAGAGNWLAGRVAGNGVSWVLRDAGRFLQPAGF